tara:strand:- start:546 stop:1424 length:879 start_codon:yes stop_codon:yes gene_type:complete
MWEPERLRKFIEGRLKPEMGKLGLNKIQIVAPDLAYVGSNGSELERFLVSSTTPSVDVVAYHMYDSYRDDMDGNLSVLEQNAIGVGKLKNNHFQNKRLWMTETTGAQWNNEEWHTYGWSPALSEYDKALLAAQYIDMTFTKAEANAFFWWGLVYSLAPSGITNPNVRQKHRDEGLVLVEEKRGVNNLQKYVERTKKYFFFKQFANFVKPGYTRIKVNAPTETPLSAFISSDKKSVVVVVTNSSNKPLKMKFENSFEPAIVEAYQTDPNRNCEPVSVLSAIPSKSVRTVIFKK